MQEHSVPHLREAYGVRTHFFSQYLGYSTGRTGQQQGTIQMLTFSKANYLIADNRSSFQRAYFGLVSYAKSLFQLTLMLAGILSSYDCIIMKCYSFLPELFFSS